MQRRKFLVGMGSLAAGGAAAMGTGAFTSTRAVRSASVDVVGDKAGYVGLDAANHHVDYSSGTTLEIDLSETSVQGGSGINDDAEVILAPAFRLKNQSPESIFIEIDNPLKSNDIGGGGVDVQFLAADQIPATQVALIDRDSEPTGLGGDFDSVNSNEIYPNQNNQNNEQNAGSRFPIENDEFTGAIELNSGASVPIIFRVVTRDVDDSLDLSKDFTLEAYSKEARLTYDLTTQRNGKVLVGPVGGT